LYNKQWTFSSVEVFDGTAQTGFRFCPSGDGLVGEEPAEFTRC
jgi:hypothetical protein